MSRELAQMRKRSQKALDAASETLQRSHAALDDHLGQMQDEYHRVTEISASAPVIIENVDKSFREKTKLTDCDIAFLMIATALQCARQYLLSNDKLRLQDKGSVKSNTRGDKVAKKAYDATVGKVAPPSWEKVLFQSVPYDALDYASDNVKELLGNSELSGKTHRFRTLGHDPVLGWIFGTANIMTSSLSKTDFITTYQISDLKIAGYYPLGTPGMLQTALEFSHDDPKLLAAAAGRQAVHFGSDYFTKQGLPFPGTAIVSDRLAQVAIDNHIDMWSISRGATLAALINQLIAIVHQLFYREDIDGSPSLYEVRTRKILSYSNALATGSNVIVTAFTQDLTKLDIGGLMVALHRFITDEKFIQEVKRDFLKNEMYRQIVGKPYNFMEVE